jgi:hypothetical protein
MAISDTAHKIPFTNRAVRLEVALGDIYYVLKTYWNIPMECWILDIYDAQETPLARGIAIVTGADLLGQLQYLGFAGMLLVWSSEGPWYVVPGLNELGVNGNVYYVAVTQD